MWQWYKRVWVPHKTMLPHLSASSTFHPPPPSPLLSLIATLLVPNYSRSPLPYTLFLPSLSISPFMLYIYIHTYVYTHSLSFRSVAVACLYYAFGPLGHAQYTEGETIIPWALCFLLKNKNGQENELKYLFTGI